MDTAKTRLVVLVSGTGSNFKAIAEHIKTGELNADIVGVISNRPDAFALTTAKTLGIPACVCAPDPGQNRKDWEQKLLTQVASFRPDLIILAGFMKVLSSQFVHHFYPRILNIHPSLLPKFKGLDTHQRALDSKEEKHGATVHVVTPDLDSGPIVAQAEIQIDPMDDAESLGAKVLEREHLLYASAIKSIIQGDFILPEKMEAWAKNGI